MDSTATLASLRDEVDFALGGLISSNPAINYSARIDSRINWTILNLVHILELEEFQDTFTRYLVTDDRDLAVPTDFLYLYTLKNVTRARRLEPILPSTEAQRDEDISDEPRVYLLWGRYFVLYPKPSATFNGDEIRGRYLAQPPTLSADADLSPLPSYLDEGIILGAVARMHRDRRELARAREAYRNFVGFLRSLKDTTAETLSKAQLVVGQYVTSTED